MRFNGTMFLLLKVKRGTYWGSTLSYEPFRSAFFLDEQCDKSSFNCPTAKLALSTCLVTDGALGISLQTRPQCPAENAALQIKDTACANGINMDLEYNDCFLKRANGVSTAAQEFASTDEAFTATATSTVEAGMMLPVATGDAGAAASATTKGETGASIVTAT